LELGGEIKRHLLLARGELSSEFVHSLTHCIDGKRHRLDLLLPIAINGSWNESILGGLRNRSFRCQPSKLWIRVRNDLSRRVTVGLKCQGRSNTYANGD
jgi:hypothetical protein